MNPTSPPAMCLRRLPVRPSSLQRTYHASALLQASPSLFNKTPSQKNPSTAENPVLDRYLKSKPKAPQLQPTLGQASRDSIFADQERASAAEAAVTARTAAREVVTTIAGQERNLDAMQLVLDPDPARRVRWERKMLIRQIQKRGQLTKAEKIARTERQHLNKSHFIKTSYKKLGMLARQIAGKPIEEAIVQMRFSKKRAAKDIRQQLELARDEAIVQRGMGLGDQTAKTQPIDIQMKDGTRKTIKNQSAIYIDQAWVGKGPYELEREFRAKGRVNILRKPYTSISVLLKEEKTRVRLYEEKLAKIDNRKTWVQLPDRPISEQRQYPLW